MSKTAGSISAKELGTVMRALHMNPTEGEIASMLREMDADNSGAIDFGEFITLVSKRPDTKDSEADMREAFKVFDKDGTGMASPAELRHVLTTIGEKLSEEEVDDLLREAEVSGDSKLKVDDFVRILLSK